MSSADQVWMGVPLLALRWAKQGSDLSQQVAEAVEKLPPLTPGYGQIWWNPDAKTLWVVTGDGDEPELVEQWQQRLLRLDGVDDVRAEAETSPRRRMEGDDPEPWVKLAYSAGLRRLGQAANFFRSPINSAFGGPSPLAATLGGGLIGAGLGYGAGWLGERLLPEEYRRGALPRTLAIAGAMPGLAAGGLWAYANHLTGRPLNSGELLDGAPVPMPAPRPSWRHVLGDMPSNKLAERMTKNALLAPGAGGGGEVLINVDAFNRTIWQDPQVAPLLPPAIRAAGSGLVTLASQLPSDAPPGYITPWDVARVAAGMGAGYVGGALAGKALGVLMGMPPATQQTLKRTGVFAGALQQIIPAIFGR